MASLKKRGDSYYIQFYLPGKQQKRINLQTDSYQIAKEKLRRFESAQASGDALPLPTRTPLADVLTAYVEHVRVVKTAKSAQTDVYYLRDVFGPICDALKVTSRKVSQKAKKRPPKPGQDRRFRAATIEADCLERITTPDISTFLSSRVQSRGLAPKTANRYREILCRLFNWATEQRGVRMPGGINPAAKVERYREKAPEIRFLTLQQIQAQLDALAGTPTLQAMVATYIYAGLRREELLWLTHEDVDWEAKPNGLIRVRAKTAGGEFWEPKTKVNRAVPISSALRPYLNRQRLRSGKSMWLFPSPAGGRWDPDNFSSDLRNANRKAKLTWGSTQRLRTLAGAVRGTPHADLYQALHLIFTKLDQTGCPELGLPALGSFLWSADALADVRNARITNRDLLDAVRELAFTTDGQARRPVDYKNLGAEELGSIYESLLELHPQINADAGTFALATAAGHERKTTGSYYTPTSLVNCLLDSALEPVLDAAVKGGDGYKERGATAVDRVLSLKVCDPACGSGHFLIAAAHRIAKRLAAVRTGEEEPGPGVYRHALRDVIGHCMYGVDLNPMAVELCKVSLWMEALEPGRPTLVPARSQGSLHCRRQRN